MSEGKLRYFTLDADHNPVKCDLLVWAKMFENTPARVVKQDTVGIYWVSTVFLGMDHGFSVNVNHEPILFETMVFIGPKMRGRDSTWPYRYCTWDEALAGHERTCEALRESG